MPKASDEIQLNWLVTSVLASSKYGDISPDLISYVGRQELTKRRNAKEALKATKNKLHQVGGAYFDSREEYTAWITELCRVAVLDKQDELRATCKMIMRN